MSLVNNEKSFRLPTVVTSNVLHRFELEAHPPFLASPIPSKNLSFLGFSMVLCWLRHLTIQSYSKIVLER